MPYTPEEREQILRAASNGGFGVNEICKEYRISKSQFYTWKQRYTDQGLEGLKRKKSLNAGWAKHQRIRDLQTPEGHTILWLQRTANRPNEEPRQKFKLRVRTVDGIEFDALYFRQSGALQGQPWFINGRCFNPVKIVPGQDFELCIQRFLEGLFRESDVR